MELSLVLIISLLPLLMYVILYYVAIVKRVKEKKLKKEIVDDVVFYFNLILTDRSRSVVRKIPHVTYPKNGYRMWVMSYNKQYNLIQIGCKVESIEFWNHFFSENCNLEYATTRDTEVFRIIKLRYETYRDLLIKHRIIKK